MSQTETKPFYKQKPIGSIAVLSRVLEVREAQLKKIALNANNLYRVAKKVPKSDGSTRITYDARPQLKSIHEKIKNRILRNVWFPLYLQGGIKDSCNPRHYIANAQFHTGAKIVINEDISNFFPSTTTNTVRYIWQSFFRFPPDVAECLTKLTTLNNQLPQGSITSTYLANLVFWDSEYLLFEYFKKRGIKYSRFIDDITVSSKHLLTDKQKTEIISKIYGSLKSRKLKPKRAKHKIYTSGKRMMVHKVNVNSQKTTMHKKDRNKIRAMVRQCEIMSALGQRDTDEYYRLYGSTSGKLGTLKRFHKSEANKLRERIKTIPPIANP